MVAKNVDEFDEFDRIPVARGHDPYYEDECCERNIRRNNRKTRHMKRKLTFLEKIFGPKEYEECIDD